MTICDAEIKKNYFVTSITAAEPIRSRLNSMGFSKGSKVTIVDFTLTKQTYKVIIEDTKVAIRKEEAVKILIGSQA